MNFLAYFSLSDVLLSILAIFIMIFPLFFAIFVWSYVEYGFWWKKQRCEDEDKLLSRISE